jgi:hypothetical protein
VLNAEDGHSVLHLAHPHPLPLPARPHARQVDGSLMHCKT